MKRLEYWKKIQKKKLEFFNKTQIKYEFLTVKSIKIDILLKKNLFFWRDSYIITNFSEKFY